MSIIGFFIKSFESSPSDLLSSSSILNLRTNSLLSYSFFSEFFSNGCLLIGSIYFFLDVTPLLLVPVYPIKK
jgi:hypothetical protein